MHTLSFDGSNFCMFGADVKTQGTDLLVLAQVLSIWRTSNLGDCSGKLMTLLKNQHRVRMHNIGTIYIYI